MEHIFESIDGFSFWEDQGELLRKLIPMVKQDGQPLRIAEVGVYKGRMTAMWMVELANMGIPTEYHTVDHFKGSAEHEKNADLLRPFIATISALGIMMAMKNIDYQCHAGYSVEKAADFEDGHLDLVYLDASHDYESVMNDIDAWLPKVRKGGIICGDDYIDGWAGVVTAVNHNFFPDVQRFGRQQWYVSV